MSAHPSFADVLDGPVALPLRVRIAGVTACVSGMPVRMRADLAALLRPFALRGAEMPPEPAEVEIALQPTPDSTDWRALIGGEQAFVSGSPARLLRDLEWLVVAETVARSRERLVWHAASLSWGSRAVTLVGASGVGKSTLTVGLALRGWRPLADDLTLMDPITGALEPFRRCFHVSPMSQAQAVGADLLTWPTSTLTDYARPRRWGSAGSQPAWIVVVRRDGGQAPRLTPISRAEAAGALYAATIHTQVAASAASVAARVAGSAQSCWTLTNGELGATLDALVSTLLAR